MLRTPLASSIGEAQRARVQEQRRPWHALNRGFVCELGVMSSDEGCKLLLLTVLLVIGDGWTCRI